MAVRFDRNTSAHASPGTASATGAGSSACLRVQYVAASHAGTNQFILGEIGYGTQTILSGDAVHPRALIALQPLDGAPQREIWTSDLPIECGQRGGIQYAISEEYLFGTVSEMIDVADANFERYIKTTYDAIFSLIESEARPHLLRMWNYFPAMNAEFQGLENYKRFCRARALAFQERYGNFIGHLPSASAIGTQGGPVVVYFIAARAPGMHRENPRQQSAYHYPPQYGPRSPSFARGTLKRDGSNETFFISGTASIVGHQSLHAGDVRAQAEEALRNIEALLVSTGQGEGTRLHALRDLNNLKIYLRHPADLPLVREVVAQRVGAGAQVLYLQGDICRRELLVEIEATPYFE